MVEREGIDAVGGNVEVEAHALSQLERAHAARLGFAVVEEMQHAAVDGNGDDLVREVYVGEVYRAAVHLYAARGERESAAGRVVDRALIADETAGEELVVADVDLVPAALDERTLAAHRALQHRVVLSEHHEASRTENERGVRAVDVLHDEVTRIGAAFVGGVVEVHCHVASVAPHPDALRPDVRVHEPSLVAARGKWQGAAGGMIGGQSRIGAEVDDAVNIDRGVRDEEQPVRIHRELRIAPAEVKLAV